LTFNRAGWEKWYGNRLFAEREIPKGEPICVTGISKWFVLKLLKTLEQRGQ